MPEEFENFSEPSLESNPKPAETKIGQVVMPGATGGIGKQEISTTGNEVIHINNYFYYREETRIASVESADTVDDNLSCPYRGLFHFGPNDAELFFGREIFSAQLHQATKKRNFIPILGASGSGKSSVVFAGLVPRLQKEGHWQFTHFRPGADPFHALSLALVPLYAPRLNETERIAQARQLADYLRHGTIPLADVFIQIQQNYPQERILLIADQFEELYTLCSDGDVQRHFLDKLIAEMPSVLVMTMRADFLGNALSYRPFADVLQNANLMLGPMNRDELTEAIVKPAEKLGVTFESGLVERILNDVKEEPGNLPLLEFALTELWEKRTGKQLTHKIYEEIGEVEGALARHADEKYGSFTVKEKQEVRRIFIQLVRPGEGTEDTRRTATKAELGEQRWLLVKKLADARLVVTSRDISEQETVEMVHEALIRNWGELREWINADRVFMAWQERLRGAKRQWEATNRDAGSLLRGAALVEAEERLKERDKDLVAEAEFIQQSIRERDRQAEIEKQRKLKELENEVALSTEKQRNQTLENANQQAKQRIKIGSTFMGMSLLVAVIASLFATQAIQGFQEASEGTKLEQAGVSALRQFRSGEIEALLSAMQSGQRLNFFIQDGRPPKNYPAASPILALQKILGDIREQNRFNSNQEEIKSATFSPDGQLIATAGQDGIVRLWTVSGQLKFKLEGHKGGVLGGINSVSFSPNGQYIATAGGDETVRLWDFTGRQLAQMDGEQSEVKSVSFTPNWQEVVGAGTDGTVRFWDLSGVQKKKIEAHKGVVNSVLFSPDGEKMATAGEDGIARIWDKSGQKLIEIKHGQQVFSASFSPDGKVLATAADDNMVRLWSLSGEPKGNLKGHQGWVTKVNFSPDGQRLATASDDGIVKLWNAKTGQEIENFRGHRGVVWSANFSPDGKRLVSAGRDGSVRLWNLGTKSLPQVELGGFLDDVNALAFSPDGKTIAAAGNEGVMRLWDTSGKELKVWKEAIFQNRNVQDIAFSADGKFIVAGGLTNIARVWELAGSLTQPLAKLKGVEGSQDAHRSYIGSVAVSPNSQLIATGSYDKTMRIWKPNGELVAVTPEQKAVIYRVVFASGGKQIITADWDGNVAIWDLTGKLIKEFQKVHQTQIRGLGITPDGSWIVTADKNSLVKILDSSGKLHQEFFSYQSGINQLLVSPDGQLIATGGMDGSVKIWDFKGRQVAEFQNQKGAIWGIAFSPDSQRLALAGKDGFASVQTIESLPSLIQKGCEWLKDYLKSHPSENSNLEVCGKVMAPTLAGSK